MKKQEEKPLILILNTSIELIEALEMAFHQEGYDTITALVTDLKRHQVTLQELLQRRRPNIVLYDIGLPYEDNWNYLQTLKGSPEITGARIFITTTNKSALERLVHQESYAFEITGIIGKPFDLDELLTAIRLAVVEVHEENELRILQNLHKAK